MDPNSMPRPFTPAHSEQTARPQVELPELYADSVLDPLWKLVNGDNDHPVYQAALTFATRLAESAARAEGLREAALLLRFDVFEATTPEMRKALDGRKRVAILQEESIKPLKKLLAAIAKEAERGEQ